MKKYLMSGVAALALCAAFTSCSKNEELFDQGAINQNKADLAVEKYNQAFLKYIGAQSAADIPANQAWGFEGYSAGTRAENKNLNEWGDPAKNEGKAWDVPDALSKEQKLRVRLYFQYHPNLTYIAPDWKDFFVQQVYKGNPKTQGPNSPEEYYRVNYEKFTGSDEMDYLFCATEATHINDFNDGEWNNGKAVEVLNTGHSANEHQGNETHVEGVTHPDQITLMVNSSAAYIGYGASTESGKFHKDCCALAGAKAIDDWADSDEAKALGIDLGAPVYSERWNRSFVGLDYESMKKADALSSTSAKALDFIEGGVDYVLYQKKIVKVENFTDFVLTDKDGNEVKYISDNVSNEAVGQKMKIGDNPVTKSTFNKKANTSDLVALYGAIDTDHSEIRYLDLDMIINYVKDGCNPTSSDKNMVKNIGGRDYVFSDWIVTLTEAKKVEIEEDPDDVCIIAEDLNAADPSDFDFNDVVFTVHYDAENPSNATITVYAAGATQPIILGTSKESPVGDEVHQLFATANNDASLAAPDPTTGLYKMINTGAKADVNDLVYPTINLTLDKSKRGNDVEIWVNKLEKVSEGVYKNVDNWIRLTATKGNPAAKLCVGSEYATKKKWCPERKSISDVYPAFAKWALNTPALIWWY